MAVQCQLVASTTETMPVTYPIVFVRFANWMSSVFSLDFFVLAPLECMSKPSVGYFYQRLLFFTVTPVLFAAVFGLYNCFHVA